ncbi:hypothetical protein HZS_4060 [Henneguya salminicola]|nr:hypothetical protein HZS_4060 [Henneguya salminicola]
MRLCAEEFGRMSEKMLNHMPNCHTSINSFMFCYPSTLLTGCFFFTSANVYGAAFKVVGNQHYTKIMKQRGRSLKCLRILHLLKKIMLFERTKHWKNIYASMVLKNNS